MVGIQTSSPPLSERSTVSHLCKGQGKPRLARSCWGKTCTRPSGGIQWGNCCLNGGTTFRICLWGCIHHLIGQSGLNLDDLAGKESFSRSWWWLQLLLAIRMWRTPHRSCKSRPTLMRARPRAEVAFSCPAAGRRWRTTGVHPGLPDTAELRRLQGNGTSLQPATRINECCAIVSGWLAPKRSNYRNGRDSRTTVDVNCSSSAICLLSGTGCKCLMHPLTRTRRCWIQID